MDRKTFLEKQPRKNIVAELVIFDESKSILVVKRPYDETWSLPGGVVKDGESPLDACRRLLDEQLSIKPTKMELYSIDYITSKGDLGDSLEFTFKAESLSEVEIGEIQQNIYYIDEYEFQLVTDAISKMERVNGRRLSNCIEFHDKGEVIYLQNGEFPK